MERIEPENASKCSILSIFLISLGVGRACGVDGNRKGVWGGWEWEVFGNRKGV